MEREEKLPMPSLFHKILKVRENRAVVYGNEVDGHSATNAHADVGLIWTGLLQRFYGIELPKPIPASVVLQMMACAKSARAVNPTCFQEDDFVDGINYQLLAFDAVDEELEKGKGLEDTSNGE